MFDDDNEEYEGNFNEDLERFENFLAGGEISYMDSDKLEFIIDHYLINGMYSKAVAAADKGIEHFPFNSLFFLRKAQAISALGRLKEALGLLSLVEKMEIPTCEFFLTKAAIFSQLRDSKRAIKYFKDALEVSENEDKDEIYLDLAMEFESAGDYQNAILVLTEAIHLNPNNEGAIYELAYCYDQIKDFEKAINCYSDFIDENPYSFTAWYNLGNAYSKLEKFEKAVWAYDYCLLINEEFAPANFNLGNAYLTLEKYQLSIDNFEKSMEIDGEDGLALCYIGECYEQLENYDLAKHYYHRSIQFIPELPEAWLGLGIVSDLEGNTIEGIKLIEKAIDLDPTNGSFQHVLAGAFEKIDKKEEANNAYLSGLLLENHNEDCLIDYSNFLVDTKSPLVAKEFIDNFLEDTSIKLIKNLIIVNLLHLLGRKEEATNLLIQCIAENEIESKKLFSINSELENESIFVSLFSN
jgi:tetratricopeptide (TPR) repeat protein